jgi:hypothetical protein
MATSTQPRLVSSAIVGVLIGGIYVAGLTGILYYTEMRDRQNDSLAHHLEIESMRREQLRGLVNEIVQDNRDLAAIAGRRLTPQDYPLSPDPSVDPRDNPR